MADEILQEINNLDIFDGVKKMDFEQGLKDGMIAWLVKIVSLLSWMTYRRRVFWAAQMAA